MMNSCGLVTLRARNCSTERWQVPCQPEAVSRQSIRSVATSGIVEAIVPATTECPILQGFGCVYKLIWAHRAWTTLLIHLDIWCCRIPQISGEPQENSVCHSKNQRWNAHTSSHWAASLPPMPSVKYDHSTVGMRRSHQNTPSTIPFRNRSADPNLG